MKKYLSIILTALLAMSALTGCTRQDSSPKQSNVSCTNTPITTSSSRKMSDNSFSKEDWQKLSALQFDGYEDMTVSDYQKCVWELTDTAQYRDLLERVSKNETLYGLKDTDETAAFLYYVLEPLTAEKWESRDYSGYAVSTFLYPSDNASLEYTFTLTILDADTLTIREYNATRLDVISGMQDIISAKTKEELQDTNTSSMLTALQAETNDLIRQLQTEKIGISIEYAYFPLSAQNANNRNELPQETEEQETRRYPNGTEEDYRSLLVLKTPNYQNMPLADFNNALLEWTNENQERMERISEDTTWNDFQVTLSGEELSFVKLTVFLSGMENGKAVQSIYTGTQPVSPYYGEELPQKATYENDIAAWCSLYYQFSYSVSDPKTVTVGERDRQIEDMINAIHAFWNDTDIESILKMKESDIVAELQKIASLYSTDNIKVTLHEEQVHFERMDERKYGKGWG